MTRSLQYFLAVFLAVATAGTLLALAVAIPAASVSAGDPTADAAVVRRFYTAINELVVDRADGDPWDLTALRRHLLTLHGAQSGQSLRLEEVVANDRGSVALVALDGVGNGGWIGVPGTAPTTGMMTDRLRVAGGRVVEYAGIATELSVPQRLLEGEIEATAHGSVWSGLARVSLAPNAALPFFRIADPVLYAVEAGELGLRLNGAARLLSTVAGGSARPAETQIRDQEVSLEPGDQILIGAGASYDLHNAGASATTALVAAILPNLGTASVVVGKPIPATSASEALSMPGLEVGSTAIGATGLTSGAALSSALFWTPTSANSAGSIWPAGVAVTSLAAERIPPAARPLSGHVRITVDRLVLSPEQHGVATLAGQTVLAVESGRGIVGDFQEPRAEAAPIGKVSVVSPGEAISRAAGERLVARNIDAAPLAVLVVTLSPAASPATTGGQRTE